MFKLFKKKNNEVEKRQNEIDILKEMKQDLQEIKELNNTIYNVNVALIHDMRNDLVKHEGK